MNYEASLRKFMIENGIKDGQQIVPGVQGRMPTAEEVLAHFVPLLAGFTEKAVRQELTEIKSAAYRQVYYDLNNGARDAGVVDSNATYWRVFEDRHDELWAEARKRGEA